jgi:hypothetical protein
MDRRFIAAAMRYIRENVRIGIRNVLKAVPTSPLTSFFYKKK